MSTEENYLWDPSAEPDQGIAALEDTLRPHSARSLQLATRDLPLRPAALRASRRWRGLQIAALAAAAALAGVVLLYFHRLSWSENAPWPVTIARADTTEQSILQVGESITTTSDQTLTLSAARIGTVEVAPNSSVELIQTGGNRHRLELKYGRLKAKIWAPPMYFGITHRNGSALDMGCEFEMEVSGNGSGTMAVTSGWVIYRLTGGGVMVPEGHAIAFDTASVSIPIRNGASPEFRGLVARLDALLVSESRDDAQVNALADQVADAADDADRLTLLLLVSRHRLLLSTRLYARMVSVWGDPGDRNPIDAWWDRIPKQPKKPREWWANWRDAF